LNGSIAKLHEEDKAMSDLDALKTAMGNLEEDEVSRLLDGIVKSGSGVDDALAACQAGMNIVGDKYASGEYFVADLIYAGELMASSVAVLRPLIKSEGSGSAGKMVICTVKGDIHDIGKNIVKALVEAAGIQVIDLGIDADPKAIVDTVVKENAKILGMSGVLTLAIDAMKDTVDALKAAGCRDKVKIIIGGAPVTADYCKLVGADAWSLSAAEAVQICKKWLA
jgi:methylmalonyl-CoA mutase cobalamin-binding domain/chain